MGGLPKILGAPGIVEQKHMILMVPMELQNGRLFQYMPDVIATYTVPVQAHTLPDGSI